MQVAGYRLQATGYRLHATGYMLHAHQFRHLKSLTILRDQSQIMPYPVPEGHLVGSPEAGAKATSGPDY
jgi:hypothetical protein